MAAKLHGLRGAPALLEIYIYLNSAPALVFVFLFMMVLVLLMRLLVMMLFVPLVVEPILSSAEISIPQQGRRQIHADFRAGTSGCGKTILLQSTDFRPAPLEVHLAPPPSPSIPIAK